MEVEGVIVLDWWCICFSAGKDQRGDSAGLVERSRHHCAFKGQEGGPDVKGHAVPERTVSPNRSSWYRVPLSGNPHRSRSLACRAFALCLSH